MGFLVALEIVDALERPLTRGAAVGLGERVVDGAVRREVREQLVALRTLSLASLGLRLVLLVLRDGREVHASCGGGRRTRQHG